MSLRYWATYDYQFNRWAILRGKYCNSKNCEILAMFALCIIRFFIIRYNYSTPRACTWTVYRGRDLQTVTDSDTDSERLLISDRDRGRDRDRDRDRRRAHTRALSIRQIHRHTDTTTSTRNRCRQIQAHTNVITMTQPNQCWVTIASLSKKCCFGSLVCNSCSKWTKAEIAAEWTAHI